MLVQKWLDKSAQANPKDIAVNFNDVDLNYEELFILSNKLANFFISKGIKKGDRIAIFLPKSHWSIVSIFGILKAGAIYVPIDTSAPIERTLKIIEDCDIALIIGSIDTESGIKKILKKRKQQKIFICGKTNLQKNENLFDFNEFEPISAKIPEYQGIVSDPAYIIYTSGSTGQPKGVVITHNNIFNFINWTTRKFEIQKSDVMANHAPMHFDLSTLDIYSAISKGAKLALVSQKLSLFPKNIVNFIKEKKITIWHSAPFILSYIAKVNGLENIALESLRYVFWAGEPFPVKYLRYWMKHISNARFFNLFGPTETTDISLYYEVLDMPKEDMEDIPIGKSCENEEVFAINKEGKKISAGEEGELFIKGPCVSPGYWNDIDKTKQNFVQNPLHNNYQDIVYKTGDLVKLKDDKNFLFLGRIDHQIKSRGYRIELGEIESALYSHPKIDECALISVENDAGQTEIYAFYSTASEQLEISSLKDFLKTKIPQYMIPHRFMQLDSMPLSGTGKIDRKKLKLSIYG